MHKDWLHPMIPIDLDRCKRCDGVWLDVGKKPLLIRLWAELQTSTDPKVISIRDKVAFNALAWENHRNQDAELATQMRRVAHATHTGGGTYFDVISILTRI